MVKGISMHRQRRSSLTIKITIQYFSIIVIIFLKTFIHLTREWFNLHEINFIKSIIIYNIHPVEQTNVCFS